jgi:hypothetical protein
VRRLSTLAAGMTCALWCAAMWAVTTGSAMASAATQYRPGTLLGHVTASGANAASASVQTGPNVMAAVVGLMAVLAFAFLVVTFIRRRSSAT